MTHNNKMKLRCTRFSCWHKNWHEPQMKFSKRHNHLIFFSFGFTLSNAACQTAGDSWFVQFSVCRCRKKKNKERKCSLTVLLRKLKALLFFRFSSLPCLLLSFGLCCLCCDERMLLHQMCSITFSVIWGQVCLHQQHRYYMATSQYYMMHTHNT